MKGLFLFALVSYSTGLFSQTNIYQPYPSDSAVWHYKQWPSGQSSWIMWLGDTIINSVLYKKKYTSGDTLNWYYAGGIRQDIPSEKVFEIDPAGFEKEISVDQHLLPGDSMPSIDGVIGSYWSVDSVDSVIVGIKYHKRYRMSPLTVGCPCKWDYVVGVGSTHYQQFNISGFYLSCLAVGNNYLFGGITGCPLSPIDEIHQFGSFNISPNPSSGTFNLTADEPFSYSVMDVYGRKVKATTKSQSSGSAILDMSQNDKGIYFVRVDTKSGIVMRRIILQ